MRRRLRSAALALCGIAALAACTTDRSSERRAMVRKIDERAAAAPGLAGDPAFRKALAAVAAIPREAFVPPAQRARVYRDTPLDIGWGQTISDPYIVALMIAAARVQAGSNVLEVGTGSGYQAAVLARLGARVATIEIVPPLARQAARRLRHLGFSSVAARAGDGFFGWPERGPFDAIIVTAGAARVPAPLLDQLRPGGRLVMPIGPSWPLEQLDVFTRAQDGSLATCSLGSAMFVPLTGRGQARGGQSGRSDPTISLCYGVPVTGGFILAAPDGRGVSAGRQP
jgi:protein-L-isoaspartate(D-aspartate) O-methyltransferase